MAYFIPCKGLLTTKETAQLFLNHIYWYRGMVSGVVSTRGSQLASKFWRALFPLLNVQVILTSAHHSRMKGKAEKTNQFLQQYLRCYCSYSQGPHYCCCQNFHIITVSTYQLLWLPFKPCMTHILEFYQRTQGKKNPSQSCGFLQEQLHKPCEPGLSHLTFL